MAQMLEVLGLSELEEKTYLALLNANAPSIGEVSAKVGAGEQRVRRALQALEERGLVSRRAGKELGYLPASPDAAIEMLVLRRREELESARLFASDLLQRFRSARQTEPVELVEIITGRDAVAQRFEQMQLLAREEVLICDRPPYATSTAVDNLTEFDAMKRGVSYRAIYDSAALDIPGRYESLLRISAAGEEARSMSNLPMKLAIADRKLALLPLNMQSEDDEVESALIQPSSLLDALVTLFELLWERSVSVPPSGGPTGSQEGERIDPRDKSILTLLSAGLSDQAVARQLGIGVRTVQRRMGVLMDRMDARTRFQAALMASKRGWVD